MSEFQEIGHCGGQVKINIETKQDGLTTYQLVVTHSRPNAAAFFGVYALHQGIPVANYGIGFAEEPQPSGCFPVMIASDSQGLFGYQCPSCNNYWRSEGGASMCPYCRHEAPRFEFITQAQQLYIYEYCKILGNAIETQQSAIIDMDIVADAVGKDIEKPLFYYSEQSQQNKFGCKACGEINDVLGKFVYCSVCGTRNDLQELENQFNNLREQINNSGCYEDYLKKVISVFDTFAASYARELVQKVPMTNSRKSLMLNLSFHNLERVVNQFKNFFDIDLLKGVNNQDYSFVQLMFHRRHVYEHLGGQVDNDYLLNSKDTSVKLRQTINETQGSVHQTMSIIQKLATNLHNDFHEIIPPLPEPIRWNTERKLRMAGSQVD